LTANPATVDARDHDNFTPMIQAVMYNQQQCVLLLISRGAQINPTSDTDYIPLNLACQSGYVEIAETLLKSKAKILPDAEGLFPQHHVARKGHSPSMLVTLQNYGADLNEIDKMNQWTPIFHAASEGKVDCLKT